MLEKVRRRPLVLEKLDPDRAELGAEDIGYFPYADRGPTIVFEEGRPFTLLHEVIHAGLGHEGYESDTDMVVHELQNARYLIEQLMDAGIWGPKYKAELVESLGSYIGEKDAREVIRDFEKDAEKSLQRLDIRRKFARPYYSRAIE